MLGAFWDTLGDKLTERWASVLAPAALFWTGGLLAVMQANGADVARGPLDRLASQPTIVQATAVVAALALVAGSAATVRLLTMPALRLLEGYWPGWLGWLRARLLDRQAACLFGLQERWGKLEARREEGEATPEEASEHVRVDQRLRRFPARPGLLMPTRLGNTLRAAETRPYDKYGLDPVRCWPHLWLVMPEAARQEVAAARSAVDAATAGGLWGLAFLAWTPWTPWAAAVGLVVTCAAWWTWLPRRTEVFGDLVESAFDLHRRELYAALRWPPPADPNDERASGALLTEYLWRGLRGVVPKFTHDDDPRAE
jgi:hypothetical protein